MGEPPSRLHLLHSFHLVTSVVRDVKTSFLSVIVPPVLSESVLVEGIIPMMLGMMQIENSFQSFPSNALTIK